MKKHILGALCALPATIAHADTLAPIIVSDDRSAAAHTDTPASIQIIDRAEIEASSAANVAELLRGRAGVHVSDLFGDGSNARIDMRGFGATAGSNVLVMVDGRRLNSSSDKSSLYLNTISLDNVEQIEVIQGSAGILFGNQAVGGAINIITRKPAESAYKISATVGSFQSADLRLLASEKKANGVGYRLQFHRRASDNYRDNNDARLTNISGLLDYALKDGRVYVEANHYSEFTETPGALFDYELPAGRTRSASDYANDYQDTRSNLLRVGLEQQLNPGWRFEGDISYRDEQRDLVQSFRGFPADPNNPGTQDRRIFSLNPRFIGQLGDMTLTLGGDWRNTDYDLLTSLGPQQNNQDIKALYGQLVGPLADELTGTFGLRHGQVRNQLLFGDPNPPYTDILQEKFNDKVTIGSAGLVFRPLKVLKLFARAEQNYRFATVDEHSNPAFGQPAGLANQTGTSYEIGSEYRRGSVTATVLAYRLDLENEIAFDATQRNINLDRTRRKGLSLSLSGLVTRDLLAGISYDFVDSEITSGALSGNSVPEVPEQRVRLFAEWNATANSSLFAEAVHVGEQVMGGDFSNAYAPLGSYTVVNLNARHERGPWSFGARINNLFDREYSESGVIGWDSDFVQKRAFFPAPERNLWLSASYQF